jgi:site-specific DNA recombinase
MPIPKFFKTEFDALATDNAIGHPEGELAYGYLRVSSAGQADEGRSGLPRQIANVHEAALKHGLKIPWECLFADDDSGFEFADRPDLSRLRQEYKSTQRRASAVVMEHLDRLSRNADWHQGYLLDEMKQYGLQSIFWKEFTSRIERAVMGAIAQDGMEQAKQRMAEGNIHKAKSGRVTARVPAYGYKLVDSQGREGETARKDTHYAIKEEEAHVVRFVFQQVIEGQTLRRIALLLGENYRPPKKYMYWDMKMVAIIIKNPAYKGEFIARNRKQIKVPVSAGSASLTGGASKTIIRRVLRPPEEWIMVPVPAIVSAEEWELANKVLEKNAQMSRRNGKEPYLLTSLIKCATCNRSYVGHRRKHIGKAGQQLCTSWYLCSSKSSGYPVAMREKIGCDQGCISNRILDAAVWSVIYQVLLEPQILITALEKEFKGNRNEQTIRQITFLENQINESKVEDEKLYKAYLAGVFNEIEYAGRRKLIKENRQKLSNELHLLNGSLISPEKFDERKQEILLVCSNATTNGLAQNAPFEVKRNIIKTIVERITLNVNEGWFELEGVIRGRYPLFENIEARPRRNHRGRKPIHDPN